MFRIDGCCRSNVIVSVCNSVLLHNYIRNSVVFLSKQVELYFDVLIICLRTNFRKIYHVGFIQC